jgi:hypothetical protein
MSCPVLGTYGYWSNHYLRKLLPAAAGVTSLRVKLKRVSGALGNTIELQLIVTADCTGRCIDLARRGTRANLQSNL